MQFSFNVLTLLTDNSFAVEAEQLLGVVGFKADHVEDFVDGVVSSHDADVPDNPGREVKVLPRPAQVLGVIDNLDPVLLVHRDFNVVRVTSERLRFRLKAGCS